MNFFDAGSTKVANYWDEPIKQGLLDPVVSYGTAYTADTANNKVLTLISASWNAAYIPHHLGVAGRKVARRADAHLRRPPGQRHVRGVDSSQSARGRHIRPRHFSSPSG